MLHLMIQISYGASGNILIRKHFNYFGRTDNYLFSYTFAALLKLETVNPTLHGVLKHYQ